MRTFVDAGVLILAARGTHELSERALEILAESRRELVASALLRIEVLPKPLYFGRVQEAAFYDAFFASVACWVPISANLVDEAFSLASKHGLAAMDALHMAAALVAGADEFVTTERITSPLFRVQGITVTTLLQPSANAQP